MIRVIGGSLKGRKIKTLKGLATRPVLARVREALFNVLGSVTGFRVLDLYAGTGAVGIEAVSRGAEHAVFVDSGLFQCRIIRENLAALGIEGEIVRSDAVAAIVKLGRAQRLFDFVFADPPYEHGFGPTTVEVVHESSILAGGGIMALTVRKNDPMPGDVGSLKQVFNRSYGDTRLVMYT